MGNSTTVSVNSSVLLLLQVNKTMKHDVIHTANNHNQLLLLITVILITLPISCVMEGSVRGYI